MVKVSVVVPVYNPGRHLRRCLDSLIGQSLPAAEFEVIFVDDGSTDGTAARLDEAAAHHSNVRVFHQPNSGWPGQPRNRGLDAARGAYVLFCDDDDWLAPDALEVLHRFAVDNHSDIVAAKMGGVGRQVPRVLFTRTRPVATLADTPLMDSLTVHKLFRRAFLVEKDLRFAEGRRRLEDHLFMVRAYLEADVISVYAEHTCYFHARWPSNASAQPPHWPSYFANLEEAIEVVERHTDPGPFRDRLLARWLRVEMVNRLSGSSLTRRRPDDVVELFDAAHQVAQRHFGDGVIARINPADRPVGRAIVEGSPAVIWERAALLSEWHVDARILQVGWVDSTLQLCGTVQLIDRDGVQSGAESRFGGLFTALDLMEVEKALAAASLSLDLEQPLTGERVPLRATTHGIGLTRSFTVDIDLGKLVGDTSLSRTWSFHAQFSILGVGGRVPMMMVGERSPLHSVGPSLPTGQPAAVRSGNGPRVELVVASAERPSSTRVRASHMVGVARQQVRRSGRAIRRRLHSARLSQRVASRPGKHDPGRDGRLDRRAEGAGVGIPKR